MNDEFVQVPTGDNDQNGVGVRTTEDSTGIRVHLAVRARDLVVARQLKIHCAFLMDTSGSMRGPGVDALHEVMHTAAHVARTKLTQHEFHGTVTTFNSDARVVEQAAAPEPIANWSDKKTKAISEQLFASGGTNIEEALQVGTRLMRDFGSGFDASVAILLTDGHPTVGKKFTDWELRKDFEQAREDRRHYILSLAMGHCPSAAFLRGLAGGETFVAHATEIEHVPDALFDGLRAFNEAIALFDVHVEVRRDGAVVLKTVVNKGFVTSRRDVVSLDLDFVFKEGDQINVTYPGGGEETVVVRSEMETREDIWRELDSMREFEDKVEEIKLETATLGFKAAADAVRQFSDSIPVPMRHRSVVNRADVVFRSLSAAPDIPVVKRAIAFNTSGGCKRAAGGDTDDTPRYRSLDGGVVPFDCDSTDGLDGEAPMIRSLGGGDEEYRTTPPRGQDLIWEATMSQSAF